MIDTKLIENALALTWKKIYDVSETISYTDNVEFSIEKFCYYLLSPEFQYKYHRAQNYNLNTILTAREIWYAIYEYQLFIKPNKTSEWWAWSMETLINLLSKI